MKTLTELLTEYLDHTEDDSAKNRARGIRRMNERQRQILAIKNYWFMEDEDVINSVADQQAYFLPLDCVKVTSVKVTSGDVDYVLQEVPSVERFDEYNRDGASVTSDYPFYYHVRTGRILIYPIPSSNNLPITYTFQKKARDMSLEDYTTGTITATNNATGITGSGTNWASVKAGAYIFIDSQPYKIGSVTNGTTLNLSRPYEGTTAAGLSYKIGDVPSIPEEFEDVLWKGACADYYLKRESKTYGVYKEETTELEARIRLFGQSKTTNMNMNRNIRNIRTVNDYPFSIG